MDEKLILKLISQSVRQTFSDYGSGWDMVDEMAIADRVAEVAWNCLILGMREILSEGLPAAFEELGRFQLTDGKWQFEPADTLLEAGALHMEREQGNGLLAAHALFYITQATSLIRRIPEDVIIPENRDDLRNLSLAEMVGRSILRQAEGSEYQVVLRQKMNALLDATKYPISAPASSGALAIYDGLPETLSNLCSEIAKIAAESEELAKRDTQVTRTLGLPKSTEGKE